MRKITGQRIAELRTENGMTQVDLATRIGVSRTTVSGYELTKEPDFDKLCDIAKLFNVTTDYLLGVTDDRYPQKEKRVVFNADDGSYEAAYEQLPKETKAIVDIILERLYRFMLNKPDDTMHLVITQKMISAFEDYCSDIQKCKNTNANFVKLLYVNSGAKDRIGQIADSIMEELL